MENDFITKLNQKKGVAICVVTALALFAAYSEYNAASDVTKRANDDLELAKSSETSLCDKIQIAQELNKYSNKKAVVQWRRGILVACFTLILTAMVKGSADTKKALLVGLIISWVCTVSIQGFMDYHLREVASTVVDQILALTRNTVDNKTCSSFPYKSNDLHGRSFKSLTTV